MLENLWLILCQEGEGRQGEIQGTHPSRKLMNRSLDLLTRSNLIDLLTKILLPIIKYLN